MKIVTKKWIKAISSIILIPSIVVGGFFVIGNADKYRGFSINPSNDGITGFLTAYRGSVLQGAEILYAPGFNHAAPIEAAYKDSASFYENAGFLLFDSNVNGESRAAANTWNVTYRVDLGSIQVGIASAYFLNYYQDLFLDASKNDKLTYAMWGGLPFSSVTSFMGGFQKGVEWANTNLAGKTINGNVYSPLEQVYGSDDFTGGFGPSSGQTIMQSIINKNPDILMPVAGPQVWTAVQQIEKIGSKTIVLGVDSPVEDDSRNTPYPFKTKDGADVGNGKRVQFSSLKDLSRSGQVAMEIINNGNLVPERSAASVQKDPNRYWNFSATGAANEAGGFGTIAVGDSKNGCVGVSGIGIDYFEEVLKLTNKTDPSLDPIYSEISNMYYITNKGTNLDYGEPPFGLQQQFKANNTSGIANLNKKGIIVKGDQKDSSKFKVILSTVTSILMDASFSQSCYLGIYLYLKELAINIPPPVGMN